MIKAVILQFGYAEEASMGFVVYEPNYDDSFNGFKTAKEAMRDLACHLFGLYKSLYSEIKTNKPCCTKYEDCTKMVNLNLVQSYEDGKFKFCPECGYMLRSKWQPNQDEFEDWLRDAHSSNTDHYSSITEYHLYEENWTCFNGADSLSKFKKSEIHIVENENGGAETTLADIVFKELKK